MTYAELAKKFAGRWLFAGDGFVAASTNYRNQHRKVLVDSEDAITAELEFIASRALHLYWNDGLVSNAVEAFVQNLGTIGVSFVDSEGIEIPFWKEAWKTFCQNASYDGTGNWASIQSIIARSVAVQGESFGRRVAMLDNPYVPFQIDLIPPTNVPIGLMDTFNKVYNGIKFNKGKPSTYYVKPYVKDLQQMQEAATTPPYGYLAFEASKIFHVWKKSFAEQRRGLPLMTPIISTAWQRSDLAQSVIKLAVNSASFAYGIKQTSSGNPVRANPLMNLKQGNANSSALSLENVPAEDKKDFYETDAGQVIHGEVTLLQSHGIERGIGEMLSSLQQIIATAMYSASFQVDGDCTKYNYSSLRGAWTAVDAKIAGFRAAVAEPLFLLKVITWYVEAITTLFPNAPEAKPILRYPRNAVANMLELMRAYEIAATNHLLPINHIYEELGIDPSEFNSDYQKTWEALQKQQNKPLSEVTLP